MQTSGLRRTISRERVLLATIELSNLPMNNLRSIIPTANSSESLS